MRALLLSLAAALLVLALTPVRSGAAPIDASISSEALAPGGPWRYTVDVTWDLGDRAPALSHIAFLLDLSTCVCACNAGLFTFEAEAGTASGETSTGQACQASFAGEFLCQGDPWIGIDTPTLKFDQVGACETQRAGVGSWSFLSPLPPAEELLHPGAIVIKYGTSILAGDLIGALPECSCRINSETTTWGRVKSGYR